VLRAVASFIPFGKRELFFFNQTKFIWGPADPEDHQRVKHYINVVSMLKQQLPLFQPYFNVEGWSYASWVI